MSERIYYLCTERLPYKEGTYEVQFNNDVNGGKGSLRYIKGKGWDIHSGISKMVKVVGWYPNNQ